MFSSWIFGPFEVQNGKPQCVCYQGYFGTQCDQTNDPCQDQPCKNGGSCTSLG